MNFLHYLWFFIHQGIWRTPLPTQQVKKVEDLDLSSLKKQGVKILLFDVDDTLTPHYTPLQADCITFLKKVSKDFSLALISNCSAQRRISLNAQLEDVALFFSPSSQKPSPVDLHAALAHFSCKPAQAAYVGDRPGTDLWAAYQAGIPVRVLVQTRSKKAPWWLRALRSFELAFFV